MPTHREIEVTVRARAATDLAREVLRGLHADPKTLPAKLFYDERGSALFEAICELPEYYLTRTEIGILEQNLPAIAGMLGPRVQLIEPGSGAGTKTTLLLGALEDPVAYVPIDIACDSLRASAQRIQNAHATLQVQALCADFFEPLAIPAPARAPARRVVFFPGSSIGNFHPEATTSFLGRLADMVGPGGGLLLGYDLRKDEDLLVAAYDDAQGVTAAFNRNMLQHVNRTLGADFCVDRFEHEARWNRAERRIEMHLVSTAAQTVHIGDDAVRFARGESVRTECCYKYGPEGVAALTDRFVMRAAWFDAAQWFGVQYLEVPGASA